MILIADLLLVSAYSPHFSHQYLTYMNFILFLLTEICFRKMYLAKKFRQNTLQKDSFIHHKCFWSFMFADLAIKKPYDCLWYLIPQSPIHKRKRNNLVEEDIFKICSLARKRLIKASDITFCIHIYT